MREIEKVSLGGYAFSLEQDAAALAREYLGELERHYAAQEGGTEILEGIEERMAELLHEKAGHEGVGSRAMIEGIIAILGRPEEIEKEDGDSPAGPSEKKKNDAAHDVRNSTDGPPKRKLYRNVGDQVIAGVCSGLGTYFQVDKVLFRIIFVLLALVPVVADWSDLGGVSAFSVLLYIALWISMPPARTARQRWEQRGEDGTLQSLQDRITNNAREMEDALRSVGNSPGWTRFSKVFEKLVGVILLIVAFAALFAGGLWTFGGGVLRLGGLHDLAFAELGHHFPLLSGTLSLPVVRILMLVVLFLPFIGILYGALQLLIGFKSPKWHPGLVIFILWLLAIIATGILLATGYLSAAGLVTL